MQADIVLFDDFETLDVFGPAEIFGRSPHYTLNYCSLSGGVITSSQGAQIITTVFEPEKTALMLVPGGQGTRRLVSDEGMLAALRTAAQHAQWCLSVCTGSALLAAAGVLDGRQATSNKRAWQWVTSLSAQVNWVKKARWCADGRFYTSSGVSAGTDMALAFIADRHGEATAEEIAQHIEYRWHNDAGDDPFAV
ncbi:DJ-1/PfpI family protein [Salmonella enterica subsp. enterica serovar Enteritidis]|uniref:DJ-1/PfpI family protein n=1 Tax=Morganella TaxID=581 RepID=UPI000666257A|nr:MULTISPECIES: DJ-1/PfpI family protein [Morganella]EBQ6150921.1 DJ-1/PfpI family protein [Salmonella enterica subsp. enterica serovar Enteritidis]SSN07429.1 cyclohexyl-isocyanide hydratase [Klebsiella pneumoniae]EJD6109688.1 DJ-1/PfpI family protein [Morganella morganii]EJG2207345.1 DJ-1/PfpI family protein [Morganella morganii]EKU4014303.1 DJ-1/PfpI family protein [Morganella morganii]